MKSLSNLVLTTVLVCLALTLSTARAQAQTPKFKEGDRVEYDAHQAGFNSRFADVEKGTIVKVDAQYMRYIIQPDAINGFTPSRFTIPIYKQDDCIRLMAAAPKQETPARNGGNDAGANDNANADAGNAKADSDGKAKYKVGDRVEVETVHAGFGSPYAVVSKGTVTEVSTQWMRYVIDLDPLPGKIPVRHSIPMADESCCIRPLAGAGPTIKTDKLRVDENGTVLADRDLLDCDNLQHSGHNGQPLPVELAKKLIRCIFEKASPVGQDGATKMDILQFSPGSARKWILYQDQGQGTLNTNVYPIHVKYNLKTFYRGRNVETNAAEMTFTCFADKENLWQCGIASGPHKDGKKEEILVKP